LARPPLILPAIRNESPFFFKDPASGRFRIMTGDGAFDSFDGACHACSPFPRVVLKVDGGVWRDASPEFTEQYDTEIAAIKAKIAVDDVGRFLIADFPDAKNVVLEIVFSDLYSGREAQAWQTLNDMWPAVDRERIKQLILKTRAHGILSRLGKPKPDSSPEPSHAPR
jgi:hypothetical protein